MEIQKKMEHTEGFFYFEKLSSFKKFFEALRAGKSCSIFGVQNSMRPVISASTQKKLLFVCADESVSGEMLESFKEMKLNTLLFPTIPDSFLYKKITTVELFSKRTETLFKILKGDFDVVVCTVESLFSFLPNVNNFKDSILTFKENQELDLIELEKKLVLCGYRREEILSEPGQFSRRGEILDIFPVNSSVPFRIDFFDTLIEEIKVLDIQTGKGTKKVETLEVCPCTDLLLPDDELEKIIENLKNLNLSFKDVDTKTVVLAQIEEIITRLSRHDKDYSLSLLLSYYGLVSNIFDYIFQGVNGDFLVVVDECKQVFDRLTNFSKETQLRLKELEKTGTLLAKQPCFFSEKQVLECFKNQTSIAFLKITNTNKFFDSEAFFNFKTAPSSKFKNSPHELAEEIKNYLVAGYKIFIFAGNFDRAENLKKQLLSHDIDFEVSDGNDISSKSSKIYTQTLDTGFILPDEKIYVLGTYDLFAKKREVKGLRVNRENVFTMPKVGDYVVHEFHGIGVCEGVTKLTGNFGTQDFVVVRYRDGDKLYVPTSHMDLLSRFSGAEKPAKLSKIGGADFSAVKEKVKKSVKKLAINLLELYATREKIKGFAFSPDNELQREFENSFPFTETQDQLTSIAEIKRDMESQKVMDRLLCGDVGFGKTEVALRCCFKAILDGKQVAFIAPTTILSEQHFSTAKSRMFDFGIAIEVLNRFKTKAQTDKILKNLVDGKVDLLIGTHRILSEDVKFKNLGLIVLDEEQKFGVEDKEKLKNKFPNVDVLTLSATPIPRTLSMSLTGIRDISIISTPPSERLPIQTYVTEYTDALVKDAVLREVSRGGQVFILFNSVEKIFNFSIWRYWTYGLKHSLRLYIGGNAAIIPRRYTSQHIA